MTLQAKDMLPNNDCEKFVAKSCEFERRIGEGERRGGMEEENNEKERAREEIGEKNRGRGRMSLHKAIPTKVVSVAMRFIHVFVVAGGGNENT